MPRPIQGSSQPPGPTPAPKPQNGIIGFVRGLFNRIIGAPQHEAPPSSTSALSSSVEPHSQIARAAQATARVAHRVLSPQQFEAEVTRKLEKYKHATEDERRQFILKARQLQKTKDPQGDVMDEVIKRYEAVPSVKNAAHSAKGPSVVAGTENRTPEEQMDYETFKAEEAARGREERNAYYGNTPSDADHAALYKKEKQERAQAANRRAELNAYKAGENWVDPEKAREQKLDEDYQRYKRGCGKRDEDFDSFETWLRNNHPKDYSKLYNE